MVRGGGFARGNWASRRISDRSREKRSNSSAPRGSISTQGTDLNQKQGRPLDASEKKKYRRRTVADSDSSRGWCEEETDSGLLGNPRDRRVDNSGHTGRGKTANIVDNSIDTAYFEKNEMILGNPSSSSDALCYPRGKLLDIYRKQKLEPSFSDKHHELEELPPITQICLIEPLAFVTPDAEEGGILNEIWKGKITSSEVAYSSFRKGRSNENVTADGDMESTERNQDILPQYVIEESLGISNEAMKDDTCLVDMDGALRNYDSQISIVDGIDYREMKKATQLDSNSFDMGDQLMSMHLNESVVEHVPKHIHSEQLNSHPVPDMEHLLTLEQQHLQIQHHQSQQPQQFHQQKKLLQGQQQSQVPQTLAEQLLYSGSNTSDHLFSHLPDREACLNNSFAVGSYGSSSGETQEVPSAHEQVMEGNEKFPFRSDFGALGKAESFLSGTNDSAKVMYPNSNMSGISKSSVNKDFSEVDERKFGPKGERLTKMPVFDNQESADGQSGLAGDEAENADFHNDKIGPSNSPTEDIPKDRVPIILSKGRDDILQQGPPVSRASSSQEGLSEVVSEPVARGKNSAFNDLLHKINEYLRNHSKCRGKKKGNRKGNDKQSNNFLSYRKNEHQFKRSGNQGGGPGGGRGGGRGRGRGGGRGRGQGGGRKEEDHKKKIGTYLELAFRYLRFHDHDAVVWFVIHGLWPGKGRQTIVLKGRKKQLAEKKKVRKGESTMYTNYDFGLEDDALLTGDLKLFWPNLDCQDECKTDESFWKFEWDKHGIHSDMECIEYFSKTVEIGKEMIDRMKMVMDGLKKDHGNTMELSTVIDGMKKEFNFRPYISTEVVETGERRGQNSIKDVVFRFNMKMTQMSHNKASENCTISL